MGQRGQARKPLAEMIGDGQDAFFVEIEVRNQVPPSNVLRAQLRAIIAGDVPRWQRPPMQSEIHRSVEKAQELLRAFHTLKNFGLQMKRWHQQSYRGPFTPEANAHIRQLGEAIHRCDLETDRAPLMWANDRWPRFDEDLVRVVKIWATSHPPDARKYPKGDPNEAMLIQLLAVVLQAAGAKISTMRSGSPPTAFQQTCYAVLVAAKHVHRSHTGSQQELGPDTEEAFYERIVQLFKDRSLKPRVNRVTAAALNSGGQLDFIVSDLSAYAHMLWLSSKT